MQEKLNQLEALRGKVRAGGGEKRIEKQHAAGKKTARERIDYFFDPGTFKEIDVFAGDPDKNPSEGVVTGYGMVDGRKVFIYAQDFTVTGGSLGKIHAQKICKVLDLAMRTGAPVVGLNDSGGARIQEGVDALNGYGEIFFRNTIASGVIPQLSVIMGPCAGGAVYSPALMDFIFMVKGTSQMFITGPQVIKAVTGEEVSMEQLGGALTHNQTSGVAHFMGENEEHCLDLVKKLLGYLPPNSGEKPPLAQPVEPTVDRETLLEIVPTQPMFSYDVKKIIQAVVDGSEFLEVLPLYARNAVIGFARINGQPVGVVANQPDYLAGCLDINASDKISRFVRFCDAFNLPLVTFMDVPGFLPGTSQEYGGIIRHGAKMLYAYAEATVPKITLALRKEYGGAVMAMCCVGMGVDLMLAWPVARLVVLDTSAAINLIYRKEIMNAEDPAAFKQERIQEYDYKYSNPFHAASNMLVDKVIDPADTRRQIIAGLSMLKNKQRPAPFRRHGNIPL